MSLQVVTVIGLVLIYLFSKQAKDWRKTFLWMAGIWLIFIMGSRSAINELTDEVVYYNRYKVLSGYSFAELRDSNYMGENSDRGFYFLYWVFARLIPWPQFSQYLIVGISVIGFFRFFYRNSEDVYVSVLLFLAFGTLSFYLSGVRQGFAMFFCLMALQKAQERRFWRFLFWVWIAYTMHDSAFVFLPVYVLLWLDPGARGKIMNFLLLAVIFLGGGMIMAVYVRYANEEGYLDQYYSASAIGYIIQIIIMVLPILLSGMRFSRFYDKEKLHQFHLELILSLGIAFFILRTRYWSYERVSYYYSFAVLAALPNSVSHLPASIDNEGTKKVIRLLSITLCIALYLYRFHTPLAFFWSA